MKKTFTIFMTIFALAVSPMNIYASKSISDLQEEKKDTDQKIKDNQAELQQVQAQKNSAVAEINQLNEQIRVVSEQIEEIEEELEYTEELLAITEQELVEAEIARDEQYELFKDRAKYMYMYGKSSYLDVLLSADSFTDLIKRVDGISRVIEYDQNMVNELLAAEEAVALKVEETEKQKLDLENLNVEYNETKVTYQAKADEVSVLVKQLSAEEEEYMRVIEQFQQASNEVEELIKKAQEEAARKAAAGQTSYTYTYDGGKLQWPVPSKPATSSSVSSGYVSRTSPITGKYEYHTGLDIPASYGSNVVAAENGVVIYSGWQNGYGNTIMIDHGGGLVTLYGHNSSLVARVGQQVSRGEVVAKVGSTGWSTGNHCHFEVRVNSKHVNPNPYLN